MSNKNKDIHIISNNFRRTFNSLMYVKFNVSFTILLMQSPRDRATKWGSDHLKVGVKMSLRNEINHFLQIPAAVFVIVKNDKKTKVF